MKAKNEPVERGICREVAEEVTNIRNQLWQITDEMPMTRAQNRDIEIIKERLWRVQAKLREAGSAEPDVKQQLENDRGQD